MVWKPTKITTILNTRQIEKPHLYQKQKKMLTREDETIKNGEDEGLKNKRAWQKMVWEGEFEWRRNVIFWLIEYNLMRLKVVYCQCKLFLHHHPIEL